MALVLVLPGATGWAQDAVGGRDGERCVPAALYLALDPQLVGRDANGQAALGTYERVSPDGRFILRSFSGAQLGKVSLIELPGPRGGAIQAYTTPFSNEAFPVQGSWRYLVDVNGDHYRFADVLARQAKAQPLFRGGMTGFYAAASEMSAVPASDRPDTQEIVIRSLSWPQGDTDASGTGPLQIRTLRVLDEGRSAKVVDDTGSQFICTARNQQDGRVYALPMLSVDGTEFSAIPQAPRVGAPSMRVYGLSPQAFAADHACDLRADLGYSPGKAVFGFASASSPALLTYTDNASVYFHDRRVGSNGRSFLIEDHQTHVLASAFPGLTRDGRIVFGATWKQDCAVGSCQQRAGYVIADPYQSAAYRAYWAGLGRPAPRQCVTEGEVLRQRAEFAQRHGLAP